MHMRNQSNAKQRVLARSVGKIWKVTCVAKFNGLTAAYRREQSVPFPGKLITASRRIVTSKVWLSLSDPIPTRHGNRLSTTAPPSDAIIPPMRRCTHFALALALGLPFISPSRTETSLPFDTCFSLSYYTRIPIDPGSALTILTEIPSTVSSSIWIEAFSTKFSLTILYLFILVNSTHKIRNEYYKRPWRLLYQRDESQILANSC